MKILHIFSIVFLMSTSGLYAMDNDPEQLLKEVDRLAISVKKLTGEEKKTRLRNDVLPLSEKLNWAPGTKDRFQTAVISRLCAEYYASAYGALGDYENEKAWQEKVAIRQERVMEIHGGMPIPANYVKNYKTQKYTHFVNK